MRPRIPKRIPPLTWRKPVGLWTPLALALALGWPALLFEQPQAQRLALAFALIAAAVACVTLSMQWRRQGAVKARLTVVGHGVAGAALTAISAPFTAHGFDSFAAALATTPLLLAIALPLSLISSSLFAWTALARARHAEPEALLDISANVPPSP